MRYIFIAILKYPQKTEFLLLISVLEDVSLCRVAEEDEDGLTERENPTIASK